MQILPNQSILETYSRPKTTHFSLAFEVRGLKKGNGQLFFSFSSFFFFWLEALGRLENVRFSSLCTHQHWRKTSERRIDCPQGKAFRGIFTHTQRAIAWNKSQNGGGRDEERGVQWAKLRVQRHEFKSRFIFFSFCSCVNLSFLIFSNEEGALGRNGPRFKMQGRTRIKQPSGGAVSEAQWLEPGALKSRSQVQSPSGSVSFSLFHSHRLKAWAPYSGRMSNKICALGHCTKQPSQSLANLSSTVGTHWEASCHWGPQSRSTSARRVLGECGEQVPEAARLRRREPPPCNLLCDSGYVISSFWASIVDR